MEMNLKSYVKNVVYQGRRLLHTHLDIMDFQKE
jgi:hypothetical protein